MVEQTFYYRNYYNGLYPILSIIAHSQGKATPIDALVDSGADFSCFKEEVANSLGIEIESGVKMEAKGVTEDFISYLHELELQLFNKRIKCKVAFTNDSNFDTNILGRLGFFDGHEVNFKEKEKEIGIKEV